MSTPKYRPSLAPEEVTYLTSILRKEFIETDSSLAVTLLQKFSVLETKIANNAIIPSHTEKPKVSLIEQLGGKQPSMQDTKEEYWAACYAKYKLDRDSCSLQEINAAKEHMYLNDLMSPEEIEAFENSNNF